MSSTKAAAMIIYPDKNKQIALNASLKTKNYCITSKDRYFLELLLSVQDLRYSSSKIAKCSVLRGKL